jgi:hypothetical protein
MKLDLILEDQDVLLVEDMLKNGVISEGVLDIIDTSAETLFGAVGFIPGFGEPADGVMLVKNLLQGDYLGAAIFLVSMEPTPFSDAIAKSLRAIQKLAQHTGQEDRLNRWIGWLVKKTGNKQTAVVMSLFEKSKATIGKVNKTADTAKRTGKGSVKKAGGVMDKVTRFLANKMDKMEKALTDFLNLVDQKAAKMEPVGGADGADMPDQYVTDEATEIKGTYMRFSKDSISKALRYKNKVKANAQKKSEIKRAYEEVFGPIDEV